MDDIKLQDKKYLVLIRWRAGSGFAADNGSMTSDRSKAKRFTFKEANDYKELCSDDVSVQLIYLKGSELNKGD